MKRQLILAVLLLCASATRATNAVYIAQAAAGANDGSSCANAKAVTYFNTGANWSGSPSGIQIGPDTTVHLCGTFTGAQGATMLTTQGAGTSGHPVTILFETGTIFQNPAWGSGSSAAINIAHQYITVDGGTNGVIKNTSNGDSGASCGGSPCTANQTSRIVMCTALCTGLTVQNLTIPNVYIHTENNPDTTDDSQIIAVFTGSSNIRITQNAMDHAATGIGAAACNSATVEVDHNTLSFMNHFIVASPGSAGCTITGLKIHDNDIAGGSYVYDQVANNAYHHNPIFLFADCAGGSNQSIVNPMIYNNYMHGVWSHAGHTTGLIFIDDNGATCTIQGTKGFNNILETDAGDTQGVSNGVIAQVQTSGSTGNIWVNNTVVQNNGGQGICTALYTQTNLRLENNAYQGCGIPQYEWVGPLTTPTIDYNAYYTVASNGFTFPANAFNSFATWQAQGYDAHGICTGGSNCNTSNLFMDLTGAISAGSVAINAGVNLSSLSITELNTTAPQTFGKGGTCGTGCVARGSTWTIGARNSTTAAPTLNFLPSPVPFGNQNIGTSSNITVTVSNAGTANQVMASSSAVAVSGAPYSVVAGGSCINGLTLTPGGTCTVIVKCAPTATGSFSGTLTVAGTVTATDALSCTGTNAISIPAVPTGLTATGSGNSVTLNWTASTGTPSGYNCLSSTTSGGPYTVFASPSGTTCTKSGLANGTYYFVVNAFNSAGTSANSSQVSATISLTAAVNLTPAGMSFGNVVVGATSGIQTIAVRNVGTAPLVLAGSNAVSISGAEAADFSVDGSTTCTNGLSVAINAICNIAATSIPSIAGGESATICLVSNSPTSPDCATMSVTGTAPVNVSPTSLAFASTYTNKTSSAKVVTFTNSTGSTITFSSVATSGGDSTQFVVGAACSGTLASGANCTTSVTFQPNSTGAKSSSLVFTFTGAGGSPISVTLTGTGKTHKVLKIGAVV